MNKYEMIGWAIRIAFAAAGYIILACCLKYAVEVTIGGIQYYLEDVRTRE